MPETFVPAHAPSAHRRTGEDRRGGEQDRLDRGGVAAPKGHAWSNAVGNRNWLIHQDDPIDRAITWSTLTTLLPTWAKALQSTFEEAAALLAVDS